MRFHLKAAVIYLHYLTSALSIFILTREITAAIDKVDYGVWVLITSFIPFFLILDFGYNTTTSQLTAKKIGINQTKALAPFYNATACLLILICGALLLISVLLSYIFPSIFNVPSGLAASAMTAFLIIGISGSIQILFGFVNGIIFGNDFIVLSRALLICQQLINLLFCLYGLNYLPEFGLVNLAYSHLFSVIIALGISFILIIKLNLNFSWIKPDLATSKKVIADHWPFSFRVFQSAILARILYNTDHIIIATLIGLVDVGKYEIALKLCLYSTYFSSAISLSTFPSFARMAGNRSFEGETIKLFLTTQILSAGIGLLAFIWLWFFGQSAIQLWVGSNYTLSRDVFLAILATNLVHVFSSPSASFLTAIGENEELVKSEAMNASLNIFLSIVLAIQFGLVGVALGTLISATITSGWYIPFVASKKLDLSFPHFLERTLLIPFTYSCLIFFCLQFFFDSQQHYLTFEQISVGSLSLLVFGFLGLFLLRLHERNCK